jgi:hypothetical protein
VCVYIYIYIMYTFSKVFNMVTLYSKYTRALTFEESYRGIFLQLEGPPVP